MKPITLYPEFLCFAGLAVAFAGVIVLWFSPIGHARIEVAQIGMAMVSLGAFGRLLGLFTGWF